MIIDEKYILTPPPAYAASQSITLGSNNPYRRRSQTSLSALPSHLLLQIVYSTFPVTPEHDAELVVLQRENLYFLETSLRLVNRASYIACMHILRSAYLPIYDRLVRPPYTSEPFPSTSYPWSSSVILPQHRELRTLDRFIALLSHEERLIDSSELHLTRDEAYRDVFDILQPRSRLEDLIAIEGQKKGVILLDYPHGVIEPTIPTTRSGRIDSPPSVKMSEPDFEGPATSLFISQPDAPKAPGKKNASKFFSFRPSTKPQIIPPSQPKPQPVITEPIPFSMLSVSFSTRKVGIVYTPPGPPSSSASIIPSSPTYASLSSPIYGGSTYGSLSVSVNVNLQRKKTLVEIVRTRDESLESCAKRLVHALSRWMLE